MKVYLFLFLYLTLSSFLLLTEAALKPDSTRLTRSTKIPICTEKPSFLLEQKNEITQGINGLPKMVLVARKATHYVESKTGKAHLLSEQDFKKNGKSTITCASLVDMLTQSYSLYAPVLLDLTNEKKIISSLWQFQMMSNLKELGVWNHKTVFGSKWMNQNASVKIYQLGHDEFEIMLIREHSGQTEYLSVKFEAVSI